MNYLCDVILFVTYLSLKSFRYEFHDLCVTYVCNFEYRLQSVMPYFTSFGILYVRHFTSYRMGDIYFVS
jgi:hypothetical protein